VAVAVIGAGAAGVTAARAAAAALGPDGGRVVLIADGRPGGGARLVADGGTLLDCATRGLDWHATLAHLRTVRSTVDDRNREAALRADGVDLVRGRARLLGAGRLTVETTGDTEHELTADRIVLAIGDEDRLPEIGGLQETRYLTATAVLGLGDLPASMVVVGGGPDGCELAQAFARFGVQVTLIEAAERLLPNEHPDASALVTQALREDGVRVFTGSPVVTVAPTLDGGAWVGAGGLTSADVAAEALLLATGRRAAVRGLDLQAAGVRLTPAGWVEVDGTLATSAPGVLAVGRVTGLLPHGSTDPVMARVAGRNAVARRPRGQWSPAGLPRVIRTIPPVAAVGLDPLAAGQVPGARISALPLRGLDQALLSGLPTGLVTLVAGPRRPEWSGFGLPLQRRPEPASTLLGATIVGPQAGELAGLAAMAVRSGMTVEQLADAPVCSSSWSAALRHAAAAFEA
jgi:pyruvate/2-oxoglutarate dehydrogenase complex dihydrolipoamide dehydrogenase (E3) component